MAAPPKLRLRTGLTESVNLVTRFIPMGSSNDRRRSRGSCLLAGVVALLYQSVACTPIGDLKRRSDAGASKSDSHDAAVRDGETVSVGTGAATADKHCDQAGAHSCSTSDPREVLVCRDGSWHSDSSCSAAESCVSKSAGTTACLPFVAQCAGQEPGFIFCDEDAKRRVCLDATRTTELACEALERCVMVDGEPKCRCVPGAVLTTSCVVATSCEPDNGGCDPATTCSSGASGRECGQCPMDKGYLGDGAKGCEPQLLSLKLSCGQLDSPLTAGVYEYKLRASVLCQQLHLEGTAPEGSRVMLDGVSKPAQWSGDSAPIHTGETVLPIDITSGFGVTTKYTLKIERKPEQIAYLKASNTDAGDSLGQSIAAAGDLVFAGAPWEDSSSAADPNNNDAADSGAVYLFAPDHDSWTQAQYLKADPISAGEFFGFALASTVDTLFVGAPSRDPLLWYSRATGAAPSTRSGAVYVFKQSSSGWKLQTKLTPSAGSVGDLFGYRLAVRDDVLLIGAPGDAPSGSELGAVYVFARQADKWTEVQKLTPPDAITNSMFGAGVELDADRIVVGAALDSKLAQRAGAAFTYVRDSGKWRVEQRIDPEPATSDQTFGFRALITGNDLFVPAPAVLRPAPRGRVYTFRRDGGSWRQGQPLLAPYANEEDLFGANILLSGSTLIITANGDSSSAKGVDGDASLTDSYQSGAVHMFAPDASGGWRSTTYIKANNSDANDSFGECAALGTSVLFASAPWEDSASRKVDDGADDNSASNAGAVYVFR